VRTAQWKEASTSFAQEVDPLIPCSINTMSAYMADLVTNHPGINRDVLHGMISSGTLKVQDAVDMWVVECKRVAMLVAATAAAPENAPPVGWTDASLHLVEAQPNAGGLVHFKMYDGRNNVWRTVTEVRSTKLAMLKRAYDRVGHGRAVEGAELHHAQQLTRIAVMLMRYEALVQARICCGMQGAIPPAAAEALSEHFGSSHECFASPLNHHYASFFSAFPDTDRWYGSKGSFFESFPREGSFECKPPFAGLSAQQIGNHIGRLLECTSLPLSFTVFIPRKVYETYFSPNARGKGADAKPVNMIRWHTHTFKLPCKSHWYISGDHHAKNLLDHRTCWDATMDTYVLWWQNAAGRERWPVTDASLEALKHAFLVGLYRFNLVDP
jgi:hypothetical protein